MSQGARHWQLGLIGLGVIIASYLTLLHYDSQIPLVCSSHGFVDCESVLTSPESTWVGVPVSLFGWAWFVAYGVTLLARPRAVWIRRGLAMAGAATVLYLVYVEFVELGQICLWCSSLHIIILSLFGIELDQWSRWQESLGHANFANEQRPTASRKSSGHSESL